MKKFLLVSLSLIVFGLTYSQCSGAFNAQNNVVGVTIGCTDQSITNRSPYSAITFSVTAGTTYHVRTNDVNWHEELTLFNNNTQQYIGGANGNNGASFIWEATFTGVVRAVLTRYNCYTSTPFGWFAGMQSATLTYRTAEGNPADFGLNQWNAYVYNGRDRYLGSGLAYHGFYQETALTYDSRNRWGDGSTPSNASGYQGCLVGVDNHTVVSKRQGFPAGTYYIDVNNHDDECLLFINGSQVFEHNGCCDFHCNAWIGALDATSTVEFRHAEGVGGSHQGLNFKPYLINGINEWNFYAFDGQNRDNLSSITYSGYYTRNTLGFNTVDDYGSAGSPAGASGYVGCDPGVDNHTVVAMRQGFPCAVYSLNVINHDDEASLIVNGTTVWTANCCNDIGVKWTGVLDATSTVEMRYAEGGGGNGMGLTLSDVTSNLDGGAISFSGLNNACDGYDPPAFSNSTSPSGGSSAAVNNGSSTYHWQVNGSNISGASGLTFDPGVLSAGTYTFRRGVTDKCGNVAYSNSITVTVTAAPDAGTLSGIQDVCVGSTTNFSSDGDGGGTWSSDNGSVATVDASGVITGVAAGTATITYTVTGSGGCADASATRDITVYANPFAANAGEDKPACINNPATLSASNPPIGSGTWTWSPSAPVYAGGTTANDYNAQVTFSAAGQYAGTWTVTNGICTSTPDDAVVTVTSANNNASLFASAGAAAESIQAFEVCEEGAWTYYAAPGSPDEYLFAINKHGSSFSAYVDIVDLPGTQTIESLGGSPAIRGTWLIGRYWNVSLLSGSLSTTVDVRFFVDPAEVTQAENEATSFLNNTAAATNMTALTFFKTVSTAFDPATSLVNGEFTFAPVYLPYTTGTLNGVTYYELTGLTSFSGGTGGFSVNDSGSPLPVELLEFNVNTVDNQFIRLDWATASEINNDGFEVLRSTDGVNFERIAWIGGNGNSTEINEYVFNDRGVDKGITYYYQLKQIDYDGQYEYFDIKSARLDGKTTFTVGALVPNPSKGSEIVSVDIQTVSGDVLTVEIYDRIGSKVKSASYVLFAADNALDINISDLAAGTYFLKFDSSMGTETKKLVVVK